MLSTIPAAGMERLKTLHSEHLLQFLAGCAQLSAGPEQEGHAGPALAAAADSGCTWSRDVLGPCVPRPQVPGGVWGLRGTWEVLWPVPSRPALVFEVLLLVFPDRFAHQPLHPPPAACLTSGAAPGGDL